MACVLRVSLELVLRTGAGPWKDEQGRKSPRKDQAA